MGINNENNFRCLMLLQEALCSGGVGGGLEVVVIYIGWTWLWGAIEGALHKHDLQGCISVHHYHPEWLVDT